jgi:hypothetical protein
MVTPQLHTSSKTAGGGGYLSLGLLHTQAGPWSGVQVSTHGAELVVQQAVLVLRTLREQNRKMAKVCVVRGCSCDGWGCFEGAGRQEVK